MLYWRPYATIIVRTVLGGFLAGLPQFTEKNDEMVSTGLFS